MNDQPTQDEPQSAGDEHSSATHGADASFDPADEATLPGSGDAIAAIRSDLARSRFQLADNTELVDGLNNVDTPRATDHLAHDETRVMSENTQLVKPEVSDDPTEASASRRSPNLDNDDTRASASRRGDVTPAPIRSAPDPQNSLIEGKAPPASTSSYWDRDDLAPQVVGAKPTRAGLPRWFAIAVGLAVIIAVAIVLTVLLLTSGSAESI